MFDYNYKLNILTTEGIYVLAGDDALYHAGLTNQPVNTPMCWTTYEEIPNGTFAVFTYYYYNPAGKDTRYSKPMQINSYAYEPIKERAIVETIKFREYFNEGILIEALQNYIEGSPNMPLLYEVADYFGVLREDVDYWLNEAREESDMSMG